MVELGLVAGAAAAVPGPGMVATTDPGEGSGGITWALQPAAAEGPDGRVSLRHVVEAGATASDLVALTNFSERAATFAVYASDGSVSPDGTFDVLPSDQEPVDGGAWITVTTVEGATPRPGGGQVLEVPAGATVMLPVQIEVPTDAPPGDHPAGVVAELVRAEGGAVQLTSRVGVRVHLRVAGEVVAAVAPESVTAAYTPSWNPFAPGTVTVTFDLANTGNVRLGVQSVASISGPFGAAPAQGSAEHREVLPGEAARTRVEIPVAPLFLAWGEVATLPWTVGEDQVDVALAGGSTVFTVWTVPWSQLAVLALLVGATMLVRALRRRSAARVQARIDAAVAAATAGASGAHRNAADADGPRQVAVENAPGP